MVVPAQRPTTWPGRRVLPFSLGDVLIGRVLPLDVPLLFILRLLCGWLFASFPDALCVRTLGELPACVLPSWLAAHIWPPWGAHRPCGLLSLVSVESEEVYEAQRRRSGVSSASSKDSSCARLTVYSGLTGSEDCLAEGTKELGLVLEELYWRQRGRCVVPLFYADPPVAGMLLRFDSDAERTAGPRHTLSSVLRPIVALS